MRNAGSESNPYQAPNFGSEPRVGGKRRTFSVGAEEVFTVVIEVSFRTGLVTYAVGEDGQMSAPKHGPCRLDLGTAERHAVEIRVDEVGRVDCYVGSLLVESNIFARHRWSVFVVVIAFAAMAATLVAWALGR